MKRSLFVLLALCAIGCSPDEAKHKAAGNVLFKQGDLEGAVTEYRAALRSNAKDPNAHTLLGNALFEQEKLDEAKKEYQTALDLDGKARAALQGLAMVSVRQKDNAGARAIYERMLKNEPHDTDAHAALGKMLYAEHDLDGAERHLREALVYAQNDPSALYTLGLTLAKKKDQVQANAIFDRLDRATPGKAYASYGRAVAAVATGHDDEALKWLGDALDRGIEDVGQVESDESFATLKSNAKFQALLASARTRAPPKKGSPGP